MEILRSISVVWSLIFLLIMFLLLYDLRFSTKKNWIISWAAMAPFIVSTALLLILWGHEKMALITLLNLSLPSLIFFIFMAKKPDGRFFSTFSLVDTLCGELIMITMLLENWIGGEAGVIVMVVSRMILFPLVTLLVWKNRKVYKEILFRVKKGWWLFAVVSMLFYALLALMVFYPTQIVYRPESIPALVVLFAVMPLTYLGIFWMLVNQTSITLRVNIGKTPPS